MALTKVLEQIPHAWTIVPFVCLLVFATVKFLTSYFSPQARRLRSLPVVKEKNDVQLRKKIQQAFNQYGKAGQAYKLMENYHDLIILPPNQMNEIKALPESKLSFSEEIYRRFNGELTAMGRFEPSFIKTITGDLTKRIPRIMDELVEETDYAFRGIVGESGLPSSVTMLPAAQRIIALLSSRVLVGEQLAHDENWITAMTAHANNTFHTSEKVWKYPEWLRPYVAAYLQEFKVLTANRREVERMLAPLISARQKAAYSEGDDEFDDILQRLIQNSPANKKDDVSYHADNQLAMSAAGIHTTAQMLCHNIFNLAAYPEHISELREELHQVLREHSTESRTLTVSKPTLAKLIKLDSFMKETQRTHPLGILAMNRVITAPSGLTLSNGLHLPQNTFTAINSYHIANDPTIYPEPERFDGFRFSKLHAQGGINTTKWQFTTVNPEFVAFGQGTHSCPGRFFAGAEIKVALIYVLLKYDITFETGQTRPSNITKQTIQNPNGKAKVVFTPRADAWSLVGQLE